MTLQLNYFKLRGRGEPIRLALNAAGIEYVDTADDQGIDFGKMKACTTREFSCVQSTRHV
jgi:hypothetical protein